MRPWMIPAGIAAAAFASSIAFAEAPAIPPLSPAVTAAIKDLSADDFATREKAVANLQVALGSELRALVQTNDPEALARIGDLLTFEQGLCQWTGEVLKLPREAQQEAFDFGLKPEVLPHIAHLYAKETSVRLDAVRALKTIADPHVTDLLAKALDDPEQVVYVAAMEAVYDRKPTEGVAEALWNRAVAAQFATMRPQPMEVPGRITFLGKQIQVLNNGDNNLYLRTQDNALATDVLVHVKPPQILPKLKTLLDEVEAAYAKTKPNGVNGIDNQNVWMYMPSQEAMRNAVRIAAAYKPVELVPALYRIATGPALQKSSGAMNRQAYFWSNRTWAIALVVQITDQTPADWNLKTMTQLQGMWTLPSEADETAAIAKLKDWWAREHDKYGGGADTRPAVPEQPDPVVNPPIMRPPIRILPLTN